MKLSVAIASAIEALFANLLRSFLTMLGIIIGVASVMTMMAMGEGAKARIDEQISALGASTLTLRPGARRRGGRSLGAGAATPFTEADVAALSTLPYAQAVSGQLSKAVTAVSGQTNWSTSLTGTDASYFEIHDWPTTQGRVFNAREVRAGAAVTVIGKSIVENLFDGTDPIGQRIRINNVPVRVIGVLEEKGQSSFGSDRDDVLFMPLSTARNRIIGAHPTTPKNISRIELMVADGYDLKQTQDEVVEFMRERRRIKAGGDDDFMVFNIADFVRARSATQETMGVLLAFMAAVALFVGGVGVMNIMLVSVTERTREIGLRMALGARGSDIMVQFLAEALVLCGTGGLIGVVLGFVGSWVAAKTGDWEMSISPQITLVSLGAAVAVGLFFGYFPARRAARLNPIDALRYE
jgi:putative ABC transport system permease protein